MVVKIYDSMSQLYWTPKSSFVWHVGKKALLVDYTAHSAFLFLMPQWLVHQTP